MGVLHVGELLTLPVLRGARVLAGTAASTVRSPGST